MLVLRKFDFGVFKLGDLFRCSFHGGIMRVWNAWSLCLIEYGILLFKFNTKIIRLFFTYPGREPVYKLGLVLKVYVEEQQFSYLVNMEKQLDLVNFWGLVLWCPFGVCCVFFFLVFRSLIFRLFMVSLALLVLVSACVSLLYLYFRVKSHVLSI